MPPHRRAIRARDRLCQPTARAGLLPCGGSCTRTCVILTVPAVMDLLASESSSLGPAGDQVLEAFEATVKARTPESRARAAADLRKSFDGLVGLAERCLVLTHDLYFAHLADTWESIIEDTFGPATQPDEDRSVSAARALVWQQLTARPRPPLRPRPPRPRPLRRRRAPST